MKLSPLGGPFITKTTVLASLLVVWLAVLLGIRLVFGLGAVSNLNDGYSWGIWLAYDVVAGTMVACGGYAVAFACYVFNGGQYHPLVRPAVLASMFGYSLGGISVLVDISRWWNFWHIMWPSYFNANSALLEVALCIAAYCTVLVIEFAPAVVERALDFTKHKSANIHELTLKVQKHLNKVLFIFIAIGMTLPTMHQSSLGTMMIPMGNLLNPLWQTPILPLLFLCTAFVTGYAIVMFEATLVSDRWRRPSEAHLLGQLARFLIVVLVAFLVIRWGDLIIRGRLGHIFTSNGLGFAFALENALFLVALVLMWNKKRRFSPRYQFITAMCVLVGAILYRMDCYLIAYHRPGWSYFPSVNEIMITFGFIGVEVLGYVLIVKFFPVFPAHHSAPQAALASK